MLITRVHLDMHSICSTLGIVSFISRNHPQQVGRRGPLDEVDDRGTHPDEFGPLDARFGFTLDVAAAAHNAKCERYYARADDGLTQSWFTLGAVWCNPPYSEIGAWVAKAWAEWRLHHGVIVMLLPANRCEQRWWHEHVELHRDRPGSPLSVEFLPGRMRFIKPGQTDVGPNERPPFGCCLLIWS